MRRIDPVVALSLFLASFTLYIRTLAPSLLYGDSAEFQTIAYTLGVGHPTGYPVYVLLAKLFTFLPVGEIAYRVNLFSAFCAAWTIALVYLILRCLGATIVPALLGSLAPAIAPLFWKHASMAEVYTPAAAFLAFVLFAVFQWKRTDRPGWLFAAGLWGGVSLGVHSMVALSAIPILLYLILSTRRSADWGQAFSGTAFGVVLFLSSFLFLDSLNSPAGYYTTVVRPSLSVWDMSPASFDSPFERLAFLYVPPQFSSRFFAVPADESAIRLTDFVEGTLWTLWLAVPGMMVLLIPRRTSRWGWREAVLLAVSLVIFLVFAATYEVFDFYVYYIPVLLLLGILAGLGIQAIAEWIAWLPRAPRWLPAGLILLIALLILYPVSGALSSPWHERIPPGLEEWEKYGFQFPEIRRLEAEEIVNRMEDNAILFTDWDRVYGFYYVAHILQGCRGMAFHETFPQEGVTDLADSAIDYIEANLDKRPIYFSERPSQLADRYKITRAGSDLFQIERK